MDLKSNDRDILYRFNFKSLPVGIKFFLSPPHRMPKLSKKLTLCEMLKNALEGNSFYAGIGNHACEPGSYILGQTELKPQYASGSYGAGLEVFRDERAASRLYQYIPRIPKSVVEYVAFSPLDRLQFDPDVLIVLADTSQTEILLRAMSYRTGKPWHSKYSSAIGCAWLLAYPYLSGQINFIATGLGFGMRRRKLFPEGLHLISIPFDQLASLTQTLEEMPWVPRPYQPDGMAYVKRLRIKLGIDRK